VISVTANVVPKAMAELSAAALRHDRALVDRLDAPLRALHEAEFAGKLGMLLEEGRMGLQIGNDIVNGDHLDLAARSIGRGDGAICTHRMDCPVFAQSSRKALRPLSVSTLNELPT